MTNISTATPAELRQTLRNMRSENLDASTQLDLIHSDIIGMDPVTLEHNGGNTDPDQVATIRSGRLMVRCLAKNAARTAAKLRTASKAPTRRAVTIQRGYPKFESGMSTAAYIKLYSALPARHGRRPGWRPWCHRGPAARPGAGTGRCRGARGLDGPRRLRCLAQPATAARHRGHARRVGRRPGAGPGHAPPWRPAARLNGR